MILLNLFSKEGESMYNNIRAEMARLGKTQGDIAELLGVSTNTLRWKLNGERPFMLDEVLKLAELFNCSLDYLAEKTEPTPAA